MLSYESILYRRENNFSSFILFGKDLIRIIAESNE